MSMLAEFFTLTLHLFITALPVNCSRGCDCYYTFEERASILDCSNMGITNLDDLSVPNETTWLVAKDNDIAHLQWSDNLQRIEHIDIENSSIYSISTDFISNLKTPKKARFLNLSDNKLRGFNQAIVQTTISEIYLGGNPINCNCDMFWFAEWLNTTYYPSGPRIVKDYRDIKRVGREWNGVEVCKLTREQMGCLPALLELYVRILNTYMSLPFKNLHLQIIVNIGR